ncbi:MAG: indole-3-glycerol phosphate synthase TrpC [Planctomycetota bacterium]|nr:indole-3-glycerol phosphate synthase TrpC [Planctomycetota bacterium]MDA1214897.1 indole-3-glycerol phosphate synthase TrpC [Planctomycetota bacterium]
MTDVLENIVAHKRHEIAAAKQCRSEAELKSRMADAPPVRDFTGSLQDASGMGLIAEFKKASPSAGIIRAEADPLSVATIYEQHGAHCMSVLTDEHFFGGSLDDLIAVRNAVSLPVLRKDFLLDTYQVYEARAAGADAILLIAECLDDCRLRELFFLTYELGMDALIEIYDPENLDRVLRLSPELLGINNRNLKTMVTSLDHTTGLAGRIPSETLLISESGIKTRDDVLRLQHAGARGILVGETLMKSSDIGAKIDELLGHSPSS